MKLNFWQILGVILLVVAICGIVYQRTNRPAAAPTTQIP